MSRITSQHLKCLSIILLVGVFIGCGRPVAISGDESSGLCDDDSQCFNGYTCGQAGYCEPLGESANVDEVNPNDESSEPLSCSASADCAPDGHCDLAAGICVECLLDEHCPVPETCLDDGRCSGSPDPSDTNEDDMSDPGSTVDDDPTDQAPLEPCSPTAATEAGVTCNDGLDNDCDGTPDGYDTDCGAITCQAVADWSETDSCNRDIPPNLGARICERFPYGGAESPNLCMDVCRSDADCAADEACYVSRRSVNLHFCAPKPITATLGLGESCSQDYQCDSGLCNEGMCQRVCVRDADCGSDQVCRATILTPRHLGQEAATGICRNRNPGLLTTGQACSAAAQCQSGACSQAYTNGPYECTKLCGSEYDCGLDERCASGMYNNDSVLGFGIRSCTDAPNQAIAGPGDYCLNGSDCTTFLCDSTYYRPSGEFLLAPYCNQHCDTDNDCPQLFPGSGANAFNLRMKCIVTSIDTIQPLVGGYCAPAWCYTSSDCAGTGGSCYLFNESRFEGMPPGICQ